MSIMESSTESSMQSSMVAKIGVRP